MVIFRKREHGGGGMGQRHKIAPFVRINRRIARRLSLRILRPVIRQNWALHLFLSGIDSPYLILVTTKTDMLQIGEFIPIEDVLEVSDNGNYRIFRGIGLKKLNHLR